MEDALVGQGLADLRLDAVVGEGLGAQVGLVALVGDVGGGLVQDGRVGLAGLDDPGARLGRGGVGGGLGAGLAGVLGGDVVSHDVPSV